MRHIVVHGGPESWARHEGFLAQLWHRAATVLRKFQHAGRTVRLAFFGAATFARVKGRGGWQATTRHHAPQIPGCKARFHLSQKPARGLRSGFHMKCSFVFLALASELHRNTGAIGNAGISIGEIRNVVR